MNATRVSLLSLMNNTVKDAKNWTYKAIRPLPLPGTWKPGQKVTSDCSWGVRLLCKWAGAADPMNNGWALWGNSTTIAATNRQADKPSDLRIGDFVTFGPGGDEHATMVYAEGSDPMLWSDGHQGAPNLYSLSQDGRVYQLRYNDLPNDPPVPPAPGAVLRAKTGYWSWLAWKLGEGDWKGHNPAAPTLRPNVPKRIPLAWWKLYAKFLLNRKKALT